MPAGKLLLTGFLLVFAGFLLILIGAIYFALGKGEVEAGGVIFIGPIPIVWGTSKWMTKTMMIIGMVIGLFLLFFYVLNYVKAPRIP